MLELRFSQEDLLRCRFAISPTWETVQAIHVLHDERKKPFHLPWLRGVEGYRDRFTPLISVQPLRGWTPDFLTPTREGLDSTIDDDLKAIRATDPGYVRDELLRTLADQHDAGLREHVRTMADDPEAAREILADQLQLAWALMVAPHWPRIRDLLDADIARSARLLAEEGLGRLLAEVDSKFTWREDVLRGDFPGSHMEDLAGRGLVLIPSAFIWPSRAAGFSGPYQPIISYPVRGIAGLWARPETPPDALNRLLGATRATLLVDLAEPAATTVLAQRHNLTPSTVSAHLSVLRDAGLVASRRDRRQVLYQRTPLGDALLG